MNTPWWWCLSLNKKADNENQILCLYLPAVKIEPQNIKQNVQEKHPCWLLPFIIFTQEHWAVTTATHTHTHGDKIINDVDSAKCQDKSKINPINYIDKWKKSSELRLAPEQSQTELKKQVAIRDY